MLPPSGSLLAPNFDASQLGPGGNLIINAAERVEISDVDSRLFTSAEGAGPAGNLIISEPPGSNLIIVIRDGAEVSASTESSAGGNILFQNPNALILRTGGRLTAEAGSSQGGGDGGNINLFMPDGFLIAVPGENSDIVANAFDGDGGDINITAQGIFNLVERPLNDNTNDINASSQFGQSGTVVINNFNLDPTDDLSQLPADTTAPTVAQRCLADSGQGQSAFVVTGHGGLPPTPSDVVGSETAGPVDLETYGILAHSAGTEPAISNPATTNFPPPLAEAQSFIVSASGAVELVAQAPESAAQFFLHSGTCPI